MRMVVGVHQDELRACEQAARSGRSDDAAIAACDRAAAGDALRRDVRASILLNRGVMRLRRQEGRAALADFDAALAVRPTFAEAHLNRGAALAMLGEFAAAVPAITTALSLGVRDPHKAYFNRGAAREALGDLRGALEDYSTAIEIRPDWGPAEAEIARFVRARHERLAQIVNGAPAGEPPPAAVR
jgi:tetratricopeptide (TPR) repeat protein